MKKYIATALVLLLSWVLMAKKPPHYNEATKECKAFNNMKHTSNTNNVTLEVGKKYRVLQTNKGQILTLIEGERVAQRWVDESCFNEKKAQPLLVNSKKLEASKEQSSFASRIKMHSKNMKQEGIGLHHATSKQNLLALSWQNAFCQSHQYKKECKRMDSKDFGAFEFVLHGLWPQPRNNQYCKMNKKQIGMDKNKQWNRLDKLTLNADTRKELAQKMPGYSSNLHLHEWVKHGSCYGTSANDYYADAMKLLDAVNGSKVQQYFKQNIGRNVTLKEIRKAFDKEFGNGAGKHVTMNCKQGLVTELWLHLGSGESDLKGLLAKGKSPKSRCHKGRVDAVGF